MSQSSSLSSVSSNGAVNRFNQQSFQNVRENSPLSKAEEERMVFLREAQKKVAIDKMARFGSSPELVDLQVDAHVQVDSSKSMHRLKLNPVASTVSGRRTDLSIFSHALGFLKSFTGSSSMPADTTTDPMTLPQAVKVIAQHFGATFERDNDGSYHIKYQSKGDKDQDNLMAALQETLLGSNVQKNAHYLQRIQSDGQVIPFKIWEESTAEGQDYYKKYMSGDQTQRKRLPLSDDVNDQQHLASKAMRVKSSCSRKATPKLTQSKLTEETNKLSILDQLFNVNEPSTRKKLIGRIISRIGNELSGKYISSEIFNFSRDHFDHIKCVIETLSKDIPKNIQAEYFDDLRALCLYQEVMPMVKDIFSEMDGKTYPDASMSIRDLISDIERAIRERILKLVTLFLENGLEILKLSPSFVQLVKDFKVDLKALKESVDVKVHSRWEQGNRAAVGIGPLHMGVFNGSNRLTEDVKNEVSFKLNRVGSKNVQGQNYVYIDQDYLKVEGDSGSPKKQKGLRFDLQDRVILPHNHSEGLPFACFQLQYGSGNGNNGGANGGVLVRCEETFTQEELETALSISLDSEAYSILTRNLKGEVVILRQNKESPLVDIKKISR